MKNEHEEQGYITLKQASQLFGYSPDYIGQLIRKGKIEGKQVYANVAWMTTPSAMEAYIAGNSSSSVSEGNNEKQIHTLDRFIDTFFSQPSNVFLLTWGLRLLLLALLVVAMLVFYFLSISLDDKLSKNAEVALIQRMETLNVQTESLSLLTLHHKTNYGE